MKRSLTLRKIALMILTVAGIIGIKVWASAQSQNQNRVRIENKTSALAVQSLRELNSNQYNAVFEIALRNVSSNPISALTLKIEDNQTDKNDLNLVTEGSLFSYWSLNPNETKSIRFSTAPTGNITLTIAAAMFSDGTTSGDPFFTGDLQKRKSGVKLAYQRILPILHKYTNIQVIDISNEAIQSLLSEIKSTNERDIPSNLLGGFLAGKKDLISDIEYSWKERERKRDNPQFKLKNKLQKIRERVEKALLKL